MSNLILFISEIQMKPGTYAIAGDVEFICFQQWFWSSIRNIIVV